MIFGRGREREREGGREGDGRFMRRQCKTTNKLENWNSQGTIRKQFQKFECSMKNEKIWENLKTQGKSILLLHKTKKHK